MYIYHTFFTHQEGKEIEENKFEKDTCIPLFTAALFTIARTWKQPRCLSADEWIKKLWYIYTMECYSAIKWNTFESVLVRWMNPKHVIQGEARSEREKQASYINVYIFGKKDETYNPICRSAKETLT